MGPAFAGITILLGILGYYVGISKGFKSFNQRFQPTEIVSDWITTHQSVIGELPCNNHFA